MTDDERRTYAEIDQLLTAMAAHQETRVLALARRLRPGLTAEDVRNPHDYAELEDGDFQFEDGILAGLNQALSALRARQRERETQGG